MFRHRSFRNDLLAAALLAALASAGAQAATDQTSITVRTTAGAIERIDFDGELAVGERRALSTRQGNPATLGRTEAGLVLELAGERFEIPQPSADLAGLPDDAAGATVIDGKPARTVVIRRGKEVSETTSAGGTERKVVVTVARHGAAGDPVAHAGPDGELLVIDPADPELALAAGGEGRRVIVTRRIEREAHERVD